MEGSTVCATEDAVEMIVSLAACIRWWQCECRWGEGICLREKGLLITGRLASGAERDRNGLSNDHDSIGRREVERSRLTTSARHHCFFDRQTVQSFFIIVLHVEFSIDLTQTDAVQFDRQAEDYSITSLWYLVWKRRCPLILSD